MEHIAFVLEIISIMVCLHKDGRKKSQYNIGTAITVLVMLIWVEVINYYKLPALFSLLNYMVIFVYSKALFRQTVKITMFKELLIICTIAELQYICVMPTLLLKISKQPLRMMLCNGFVFIFCYVLSLQGFFSVRESYKAKVKKLFLLLCLLLVCVIVYQNKVISAIRIDVIFYTISGFVWIVYLIVQWMKEKKSTKEIAYELLQNQRAQENYKELIEKIRLRQHEFKNHLTTMLSAHYVHKTYENLVRAQDEHYAYLKEENKYNDLLLLGENIIAGFLYGKFQEAEKNKIKIQFDIQTKFDESLVNKYKLIEILGILFDNAMEAVKDAEERIICLNITYQNDGYYFSIRNPNDYVSNAEIEDWFQKEYSQKGIGRGIGLYHARKICEEENCYVGCRNITVDNRNWIEFILEIANCKQ